MALSPHAPTRPIDPRNPLSANAWTNFGIEMPKPYAQRQFRNEAVRVALNCDDGVAINQTH
ncbi:hypothetical protein [Mycobacterium intermedium]|uniref:hypothetical protein n=1 Tax=Mycobacterium intermedium TaxID=28445 RepID=UPI001B805933|nr:hypothetical protein [Mycobacterium intermedium]